MIDTISLQSPFLTEEQAEKIEQFCTKFLGIELETGGLLYEFTRGQLTGSFDSRISLQLKRDQLIESYRSTKIVEDESEPEVYDIKTRKKIIKRKVTAQKTMISEKCDPYIVVECSIHKAMMGHNVYGGPIDFQKSSAWLIKLLKEFIGIDLPEYKEWQVRRIDIAEVFDLGSFEAVQSWFGGMNHCAFPRRKVSKHGQESIYVPSAKTTIKVYHKGPEFNKHDKKRLLKFLPAKRVNELQIQANNLLRIEVEVKSKKFRELFGRLPNVSEVTPEILSKLYDKEVFKLLREAQDTDEKEIYRTSDAVMKRLYDVFKPRLARSLYSTWLNLATNGEERVKQLMSENTFYTHRRHLIAANISWLQTDISLNNQYSLIPQDFKPVLNDPRRLGYEDDLVRELLAQVA